MNENISPKVQNQLAMLQQIQQQLQMVASQKSQFEMVVRESNKAIEELKDVADDAEVFMTVGSVIVQKDRDYVAKSLNERVETLEVRIKSLEKQEKVFQSKYEELSAQIKAALEKQSPGAAI